MKTKIKINNITCQSCVSNIEKVISKLNGIYNYSLSLISKILLIDYDENIISLEDIFSSIKNIGYDPELYENIDIKERRIKEKKELKKKKIKLIISIISLLFLIYFSLSLMINSKYGISIFISNKFIIYGLEFLFAMLIIIINFDYYSSGLKSLIKFKPTMNSLVFLGSFISLIYSIVNFILMIICKINSEPYTHLESRIYFESAGMILVFVSLGKYLENKATNKTSESLSKLLNLAPDFVSVIKNKKEKLLSIDEVKINDVILIKPGEIIPLDGVIIEGYSSVDESSLTGESKPIIKNINDEVISGTTNLDGTFKFKVTKIKEDTTLNKLINLIEEASNSKAKISRIVDKIASIFIPIVLIISLITFIIWISIGNVNLNTAINYAITVLVISCPCALGLASPTIIMVGVLNASEKNILVKDAKVFGNLNKVNTIVFDKTGTLTLGKLKVNYCYTNKYDNEIFNIEKNINHPISNAVNDYIKNKSKINDLKIEKFKNILGYGVDATISKNKYLIGNLELMKLNKIKINKEFENLINKYLSIGSTIILVSKNNSLINLYALEDEINSTSKELISKLQKLNYEIYLTSGDNKEVTSNVANELNIKNYFYNVKPEDKLNLIKKLYIENKKVLMIGDGINDAAALKASDVSLSVINASDIAKSSSDIILMNNNLNNIYDIIMLSKKVYRNIKINIFYAFIYNLIMIPIAAGLLSFNPVNLTLNPMIGSLAMSISSICVVLNALRLKLTSKK